MAVTVPAADTVGTTVPEAVSVGATVPDADKLIVLVGVPVVVREAAADFVSSAEPVAVRLADPVPVCERVPTADIDEEVVAEGDFVLVTE